MIEGFQLSPQQMHLWSLQQTDHSSSYSARCAVLIEGPLDITLLEVALEGLFARHEILRTTIAWLPETTIPAQVISESGTPSINRHNLRGLEPREQASVLESLFQDVGGSPFDRSKDLPARISLAALSADRHMLLVTLSAFCADMATLAIFVRELSRLYSASQLDETLIAAELQYADVAQWANELLESADTSAGRDHWRRQNLSSVPGLTLPFEHRSSTTPAFDSRSLSFELKVDLTAALRAVVQKYDTSTSVYLLACWQTLLWRLAGQPHFIVGMTCDGRTYDELREIPGLLAQSVPLQCHLEKQLYFSELLKPVKESAREALEWQEYFAWNPIAGSNATDEVAPFFPVVFEFNEQPVQYSAGDVTFAIQRQNACTERFTLKLSCVQRADLLSLEIHYDCNVFREEDIERLVEQLRTLVESAANAPEASVGELEILSATERQRLLVEFNETEADYPGKKSIHQLFEEQVERTPNNIAVACGDLRLTYAQLNARVNQLAHHLGTLGVRPEVLVCICMERCTKMLVGLLGILKAGGAYVPLDAEHPRERSVFVLEDTRAPVLLTRERMEEEGITAPEVRRVHLGSDWDTIARESEENPDGGASDKNAAYVIYTSGSTRQPKGVIVEHAGLVNAVN